MNLWLKKRIQDDKKKRTNKIRKFKENMPNNSERSLKKASSSKEDPSKNKKAVKYAPLNVKKAIKDTNSHENRKFGVYFAFFTYFS